ncbi:MAG: DUF2795 domain-containing protein [Chloroflexota bacterium]|nr:MAG: DUF2795 domain-containing protein [Chloroflexota bacterium]
MEDAAGQLWESRVGDYLVWLSFPATRQEILDRLRQLGLPPSDIYAAILALPEATYDSPREVARHVRRPPHYREQVDTRGVLPRP